MNTMQQPSTTRRGMTLVEILAVVIILGLIAGTLMITLGGTVGRSRHELAKTGIAAIVTCVEAYELEKKELPPNSLGLAALSDGHAAPNDTYYLSPDKLLDPWDQPYMLIVPGPGGHPYEVICYGKDGQPGGTDENADISSTNLRGDTGR